MNNISTAPESIFSLLVPTTNTSPPDAPFIELCGSRWMLTEFASISDAPPYTCISYSWDDQKNTTHPLNDGEFISDRAIPAIEATIKALQPLAIWVDALCVPSCGSARATCLQSLGSIYHSATQVCAVLSDSCSNLLCQIHETDCMNSEEFLILDNENWINRPWIYQETANSKDLVFITQGGMGFAIHEMDFLNALLKASSKYKKDHNFDSINLAAKFPRLDSLENIIGELAVAMQMGQPARPAYQVLSEMHRRTSALESELKEDHFYVMIGAITTDPLDSRINRPLHMAEYFMQVCEAKDDYSFIYCIAPRSEVPGRCWRPDAGQIPPVTSRLNVYGNGQFGRLKATHLQLDNMCKMYPATVNSTAIKSIGAFLENNITASSSGDIADAVLERLRQKGFTGSGEYMELENGYFFSQSSFTRSKDLFVAASEDVQWTNGGPALLLRSNVTDINQFCDVGAFVGRIPKGCESINVG